MFLENFSAATQPSAHQIEAHQLEAEKMDEIIDFILQGKYSSACLLLLESTGQDPLHYIPYRTYNRLQKQRQQAIRQTTDDKSTVRNGTETSLRSHLNDLDYVEALPDEISSMRGGFAPFKFTSKSAILAALLEY